MGEHTGTHFDAPVHWITGRDLPNNATDTIPARQFIGPACVIDVTSEVAANEDFLLERRARAMGGAPRPDSARRLGVAADGLEPAVGRGVS